jgi:hypothetical protein
MTMKAEAFRKRCPASSLVLTIWWQLTLCDIFPGLFRKSLLLSLFLIVNPSQWFGSVWNIIKPMLSTRFQEKVHMIPEDELGFLLEAGYERYLPDEFVKDKAPTDELVQDFITFQQRLETVTSKVIKRSIFFNRVTAASTVAGAAVVKRKGTTNKDITKADKQPVKRELTKSLCRAQTPSYRSGSCTSLRFNSSLSQLYQPGNGLL